MKIFHEENNREVVYVSTRDILFLINETRISIPRSLLKKVTKEGYREFLKFEDPEEVVFFKNMNDISTSNYEDYRNVIEGEKWK